MKYKHELGAIFIGIFFSIFYALYNNFPILYPDSSTYLASGLEMFVPVDRPIFYGIFLRATHMADNLFFSIIAQGIISTICIYLFFQYFSPVRRKTLHFLVALFVLTCFTGYSFFVSYIMPDMFTSIMLIAVACILFGKIPATHWPFWIIVLLLSIVVHSSHFPILILLLFVLIIKKLINYKSINIRKDFRKVGIVFLFFCAAFLTTIGTNYAVSKKSTFSSSSHVFLISRLNEVGILHSFLSERCGEENYSLCEYRDELNANFIWDSESPLYKTGAWADSKVEYQRLIGDICTSPKWVKRIISASFASTIQQLGSFEIEPHNSLVLPYITERFKAHKFDQNISFQNRGNSTRLDFKSLNTRQEILVLGSLIFLFYLLFYVPYLLPVYRNLIYFFLLAILINAFVCGSFSTVLTRYQGRVIYLLPLVLILVLPSIRWRETLRIPTD